MKVSTTWLRYWLRRTMSDDEIVRALEQAGAEIEQYISSKPIDKNVVVALVKKVVQHPAADRLKLVFVDKGSQIIQVVCGAPNVAPGMKVALAQVGSVLPGGEVIKAATLRGEASEGMLCSERELGLGPDHEGILALPTEVSLGAALCDIYPQDAVVEVKTQANRFDLLSVVGLAREVAAITKASLKKLPEPLATAESGPTVAAEAMAARFMLQRLEVKPGTSSPDWMVSRLQVSGVRGISPVVDVTNYVNLELGQPLHAYDAAKLKLPLVVRHAKAGEKLMTLDGVERVLSPLDLIIADGRGPVGLAGVMGGARTEVGPTTTEILLEAATFDPRVVRKMAKRHGLRTEASARFERGLPVQLAPVALARATELMAEVAGGRARGVTDQLNIWPWVQRIGLRQSMLERLLGFRVDAKEAVATLARLEIEARPFDIVAEARSHLGKPYKWGAKYKTDGTEAFDCSYLTDYLYSLVGVTIGHTAHEQWQRGQSVELADLKPGDLLFRGGPWRKLKAKERGGVSHVAVYVGQGKVVHADNMVRSAAGEWTERTRAEVVEEPMTVVTDDPQYLGARRYVEDLGDLITVPAVPWWRPDLKEPQDLVEEIVRVLGYDRVPSRIPTWRPRVVQFDRTVAPRRKLQRVLYGAGLFEVMTYSFVSAEQLTDVGLALKDHLKLKNPLSSEQAYLRSSLLASQLGVLARNRTYAKELGYYELSRVFVKQGPTEQPAEPQRLAVTLMRPRQAYRYLKGVLDVLAQELGVELTVGPQAEAQMVYAPDRLGVVKLGRRTIGTIGQLHPAVMQRYKLTGEVAYMELEAEALLAAVRPRRFAGLERFPSTQRDIAVVVPVATTWQEVAKALSSLSQTRVSFVSDYYGAGIPAGHKSLALRLTITYPDRTPTEGEATDVERRAVAILSRVFGAHVRS